VSIPPLPHGIRRTRAAVVANGLHSVAIHLLRRVAAVDREMGITPERASVLSVLAFAGPRTVTELAEVERVARPGISRTVAALEDAGLVTRTPDAGDARAATVAITAAGRELIEHGRRRRVESLTALFDGLPADELATLRDAAAVLDRVLMR
jgi:DNA-binding MarR family transcriptional regulator